MLKSLNKKKMAQLRKEINLPLIVNLSHQKGGVGKSTLAYNIADAFRILGFKVKLLDLDIQNICEEVNALRVIGLSDVFKKIDNFTQTNEIFSS